MSVLADGFNVIARLDALDSRHPGGRQTYKTDCPNRSYCADDNVCRGGFMIAAEALEWVDELEVKGHTRRFAQSTRLI
jgi:hypothetical protein